MIENFLITTLYLATDSPTQATSAPSDIFSTITVIVTTVFGAGGLTAILKYRIDAKRGVIQDELAQDLALDSRVKGLLEIQVSFLIDPLRERVKELETKQLAMQLEFDNLKVRYKKAIGYASRLLRWIATTFPGAEVSPPPPPPEIEDEIL